MQSHEGPAYHAHSGFHSVHEAERADVEDMESSAAGAVAGAASSANEAAVSAETTTFRRTDRSNSQVKFTTQGDSAIEAAMRRELAKLVATAPADERAVWVLASGRLHARSHLASSFAQRADAQGRARPVDATSLARRAVL